MGKYFLVIFFLLISTVMRSQDPFHRVFNISDGLPSNEVHDIYIDSLNQIWFTTDRGVCIYDGYDVKTFTTSDGLSFNTNFKIIPDRSGRLWFTGYDGSLSYYENGKFYKYEYNDILKKALGTNWVYYLEVDDDGIKVLKENVKDQKDLNEFIKIDVKGNLSRISFKNKKIGEHKNLKIMLFSKFFSKKNMYSINSHNLPILDFEDSNSPRLFILNNNSHEIQRFQSKSNNLRSLVFALFDGELKTMLETESSLHDVFRDTNNNLIFSSSNGLIFFSEGNLNKTPTIFFKEKIFTSVRQDAEGNYWASTLNHGLIFIASFEFLSKTSVRNSVVNLESIGNHLLVGTNKFQILSFSEVLDSVELQLHLTKHSLKKFTVCEKTVHVSGTWSFYENENGNLKLKNFSFGEQHSIGFVRENGDRIIAKGGITVFREGKEFFSNIGESEKKSKNVYEINSSIYIIKEDLKQQLFFANLEGLFCPIDNDFRNIRRIVDKNEFLSTRIQDLKIDQYNNKWIASIGNGLLCLLDNEEVIKFDLEKGISSDIVQAIEFENDSTIWIGTNKGLDRLRVRYNKGKPQIVSTINYNNTDGLTCNFILALKIWKDRLWIGTSNGLLSLDTDYNPTSESVPEMKILSAIIEPDSLVIRSNGIYEHDQNNLFIRYNGISYRKPKKNFYSYTLQKDNEEERWINTDQRELRIDNLPHGDYTFKVKAQNKYKEWSSTEELRFCIKKHFSQTWWFRILALLLFFYLIYFLYQRRLEKELEKQQIKRTVQAAKLQTEIAELTTFRNQFNPHFIFNLLNSIQNSIFKDDAKQANFYLSSFGNLMRKSLNLMSQKYVTLHEEIQFLKAYLDLEFLRFPEKFKYRFEIDEEIIEEIILIPPLLFQPAIENVLKHAFNEIDNGQLIIFIKKVKAQEAINIKVADNGSGINVDRKTERDSFGLKIIEDRIKLLKIEFPHIDSYFKIHSNRNSLGTIAEFQIPLINLKQRKR